MATWDTPGMVTITPNARLCRRKSMAVARGLAIVKPDEPFLVKLCNFGKGQVIVRKNPTLGFPETYQGPMLSAVFNKKNTKDGTDDSSHDASRDPLEDLDFSEAPEYPHKQIRDMLKRIRLFKMEPLASSVLRSTPSSLLQMLCPYGLNPTGPGRSNVKSSLIRSKRC